MCGQQCTDHSSEQETENQQYGRLLEESRAAALADEGGRAHPCRAYRQEVASKAVGPSSQWMSECWMRWGALARAAAPGDLWATVPQDPFHRAGVFYQREEPQPPATTRALPSIRFFIRPNMRLKMIGMIGARLYADRLASVAQA